MLVRRRGSIHRQRGREVAMSAERAAARLNRLIDSTSERVAFEATRFSLATAGIKPASDAQFTVNLDLPAGYVLDLREHIDRSPSVAIDGAGGIVVDAKPRPSQKSDRDAIPPTNMIREAKAKARFDIICGDWRGTDPDFVAVRLSLTRADLGVVRLAGYVDRAGRSVRQ